MKKLSFNRMVIQSLKVILLLVVMYLTACEQASIQTINLAGEWQFSMDPNDRGIEEKWFERDFSEMVQLPGSMVENNKGYDITLETEWTGGIRNPEWYNDPNYEPYLDPENIRFPFWLQPDKKYTGPAWYLKKVDIPQNWKGKTIHLRLERPHWESTLWVNGKLVDMQNSLASPHDYDLSEYLVPGENTLAIRIDNRTKEIDPGHNSHSISDHTQSNWNGIVGELSLDVTGSIVIENVIVSPDVASKTVDIEALIVNKNSEPQIAEIIASAQHKSNPDEIGKMTKEITLSPGENTIKMSYPMGSNALLWDEFEPNVYQLDMHVKSGKERDEYSTDFGLREIKVNGNRFEINGRPIFLRGTLECAIFPLTGYPPTDEKYWKKIYTAVKDHGLNHVRFHSWCPPEAAFNVADEMGVYLQVECSSWANQSSSLGSGRPIDQYIWDESKRIIKAYGNHPSFVMMAYGNEPGGPNYGEFLTEFVNYWKETDNCRVYTSAAGWPVLEVNQYHNIPKPRIQAWGEELNSIINSEPPKTSYDWAERLPGDGIPVVSHEIGQWCVYPNFKEIKKYTGVLKPKNFEIFQMSLKAHGMEQLADSFLLASGKLQALCYKADIEAALRTPDFAGFQLLDLHDFPGQGTALVGVLDPFWEEKGYISPEEYSRFCNSTVPLARLDKRIFTEGEQMVAKIEVASFNQTPLKNINPKWRILHDQNIVAEGTLGQRDIPIGNAIQLGEVVYEFQKEDNPRKLTLEVEVGEFENSWDIWVYPENQRTAASDVKVVDRVDKATMDYLENGGKVLLSLGPEKVSPEMGGEVGIGFSSIFWNTAWTDGQKPHTLGILCNPEHPVFAQFPTEYHSNWQWWDAMSHSSAILLESFSNTPKPLVRVIDDWVSNRQLGILFEAKVGSGKIMVSGIDLKNNMESRPEARQLLSSILSYMTGDEFSPNTEIEIEEIRRMIN